MCCPYAWRVANVLVRAPLIPCYIGGNRYPTIPHCFKDDKRLGDASADTQRDRDKGSRLYEVNIWMWRYGRGRSRMVSIAEAERIRSERVSESRLRAAETRKRRSEAAAAAGADYAEFMHPAIGFDVDFPADLDRLVCPDETQDNAPGERTRAWVLGQQSRSR
jgi:hypothetical protein